MTSTLPYDPPERWQLTRGRRTSLVERVGGWVLLALGLTVLVSRVVAEDPIGLTIMTTLVGFGIALLAVAEDRAGGFHGTPRFINAFTVHDPSERPTDDWVHFFADNRTTLRMSFGYTIAGLVGIAGYGMAIIFSIQTGAFVGWIAGGLTFIALVAVLAGVMMFISRWRMSSFGRRHVGFGISRHGLIRYYLDESQEFAWEDIRSVASRVKVYDKETSDFNLYVTIATDREWEFSVTDNESHPYLIATVFRFYQEHPYARGELGTSAAQKRIAGWARELEQLGQGVPR